MFEIVERLNHGSAAWADLAGAVLWQSLLVAGMVTIACHLLRRANPAVRYWLWQIVAIKLLVMPLWTVSVALPVWWEPTPVAPPLANHIEAYLVTAHLWGLRRFGKFWRSCSPDVSLT